MRCDFVFLVFRDKHAEALLDFRDSEDIYNGVERYLDPARCRRTDVHNQIVASSRKFYHKKRGGCITLTSS